MSKIPIKTIDPDQTREVNFLIRVLSDHVSGRETALEESLNWDLLFRLSHAHQVSGVVYVQCKSFIPEARKADFEREYSATLFSYMNRLCDNKDIQNSFSSAHIPFFFVKGLEVAQYYPVPALRTMGDCDLVIRSSDVESAVKLLRRLGYEDVKDAHAHAWICQRGGRGLELHEELVESDDGDSAEQRAFFNDFLPYVNDNRLDWSFHFLFLLLHLRKHFFNSGVGVRQFMDLAVMIARGPELRWDWMEDRLKDLGLQRYAHICYGIIEAWFGIHAPVDYESIAPQTLSIITEKVLNNGVFGLSDVDNQKNIARNFIIDGRGPRWLRRTAFFVNSLFLPYRFIKHYPGCGYLKKRPYLLPVAWVQRFVILLRRKDKSSSLATVQHVFLSKEDLTKQENLLELMGLRSSD